MNAVLAVLAFGGLLWWAWHVVKAIRAERDK